MLRSRQSKPLLGGRLSGGPEDSPITMAVVCRTGFNINTPAAAVTIRLGFCHGFAQVGVRHHLVSVHEVARVLPKLRRPVAFVSCYDYVDLNAAARRLLQDIQHFIWVPPWFEDLEAVYARHNLPDPRMPAEVTQRILESGAAFVWAPVPRSALVFYDEWRKRGQRLESIPLACDTTRYYPEPKDRRYADVKMAFVGGYLPYKNRQFEKFLKPYESILAVYGYNRWPYQGYQGYQGLLRENDERALYQNARVCPALSEPHAEVVGDIVERAFKIMGSGGLAVTDVVPFYRDLFAADELLVPSSVEEYHDIIHRALNDDDFNRRYREKGYRAVLERHTYAHRAQQILDLLGLSNQRAKRAGAREAHSGTGHTWPRECDFPFSGNMLLVRHEVKRVLLPCFTICRSSWCPL